MPTESIKTIEESDKKDQRDMIALLLTEPQISVFIAENLKPLMLSANYPSLHIQDLRMYSKLLAFLDKLGWLEHTSDWDPYLKITFRNGEVIETPSGYWDFTVSEDGDNPHIEVTEEDSTLFIDAHEILTIELISQ